MKQYMLTAPPFDADAARYALQLLDRVTVQASEVMAFLHLRLALEQVILDADAPPEAVENAADEG